MRHVSHTDQQCEFIKQNFLFGGLRGVHLEGYFGDTRMEFFSYKIGVY